MSEYQYYEFRVVDSFLTEDQMSALRLLSSRAKITSTRFVYDYSYGNFRGDSSKLMETYFDVSVYTANWGTRALMIRLPGRLLGFQDLEPYCTDETLDYIQTENHTILTMSSDNDTGEWVEGEGWLDLLLPIRMALMEGDLRALYLGWLLGVQAGCVVDDDCEPPLPAGLGEDDPGLRAFADFFGLDRDLLAAAAERAASVSSSTLTERDYQRWASKQPAAEKDWLLAHVLAGSPTDIVLLRRQIKQDVLPESHASPYSGRTVKTILQRQEAVACERRQREAKEKALVEAERRRQKAQKRRQYLESLVGREEELWQETVRQIEFRHARGYEEAVRHIQDLHELATITGNQAAFAHRLAAIRTEYSRRPALRARLEKAGFATSPHAPES